MKTNKDLFETLLCWLLFLFVLFGCIINKWTGVLIGLCLYIFVMIIIATRIDTNNYFKWCNKPLKLYNIFGITFKWFSYGR